MQKQQDRVRLWRHESSQNVWQRQPL